MAISGLDDDRGEAAAEPRALAQRIALVYRQQVSFRRRAALCAWLAFIVTFVLLRLLTYGIRYRFLPFQNVVIGGGLHVHHFVWGIVLLILVGFAGLMIENPRWHPWLAVVFGIGAALVLDEFAIWLNLSDVYWTDQGRISVDVVVLVAAVLGVYYAATRFWQAALGEVRRAIRVAVRGERLLIREEERLRHRPNGDRDG
ncbi:MAG: hypothetical protein JF887_03475 [Candidatus Dormibacteraeota bacterium]|uniref:Uncharacterized protein n=1 Tax=Candidatus Amunia macphersoniae TaxID=3127014 RepID=A0A934KL34_9BACT|nr:hypothetical protein [Candidatus Dormibacteraeota bacterium]